MRDQTNQLWETCYLWLKKCGVKVHKSYCKEEISTHPDYPALTSVVNFLESGGMSYHAVKASPEYIQEFTYPVLAHIQSPGQEYMHIVPDAKYWDTQNEITQNWSGIVVVPGEKATWNTRENSAYLRSEHEKQGVIWAICFITLILIGFSVYRLPNLLLNAFGLLAFAGILTSILLQGNELGFQSQTIKQVCGLINESGCERVMKSNYGRGFAGITPADASLIYFITQFLLYIAGSLGYFPLFSGLVTIAYMTIGVIAWSIYTQAVKLKEWCALCVAVVAILSSQVLLAFSLNIQLGNLGSMGAFTACAAILAALLLPVKRLVKVNNANKIKLSELKKWKTDGLLFISQWQQEKPIDDTKWHNDLILGSIHSPLWITVACNPYCNPCAKTHQKLDDLLERYNGKLSVQIRLMATPDDANNKITQATRAILQKAAWGMTQVDLQAMMTSWFEKMNLQSWADLWKPDITLDVQKRLEQHQQWMTQTRITYTPTLFLNGRKIPGRYSLEDIEPLLPQLLALLPSVSRDTAVYQ
ncbi:thioredoxin domain-containing protein [Hymenobacter sp. DH14]|uniref:Thioredoxin domain-containing protein n=1 Tax=Hymenobacter cyanobacteriorum TaxID=2926463 RepID=A0A9X1VKM4_9BACT|nr:vitamin K epoxide reductase family protein [Hymenobacter cyanobacteriorum]MCI1189902.1 thioredoxin domain-containing protein [Hymenobacter cyanobacteriorum]